MAFRWRADDGPLTVVFESSLSSSTKNIVKVGPPLAKLSGSAHGDDQTARVTQADIHMNIFLRVVTHTVFFHRLFIQLNLCKKVTLKKTENWISRPIIA